MFETGVKVSVISVYYNRADVVKESVESLLNQTLREIEILLVNDGSTDDTLERIMEFQSDPRVKVINHGNRGLTRSLIRAIDNATGDYVAIHGAGDYSAPDRLEKQAAVLDLHSKAGIVGCFYRNIEENTGAIANVTPQSIVAGSRGSGFQFSHGELMYRKSAYHAVGGYREWFTVGQGSDLWRRMINSNWEAEVVPEYLYDRFVRSDGVSTNLSKLAERSILAALSSHDVDANGASKYLDKMGVLGILKYGLSLSLVRAVLKSSIRLAARGALDQSYELAKLAINLRWYCFPIIILIRFPAVCRWIINRYSKDNLLF